MASLSKIYPAVVALALVPTGARAEVEVGLVSGAHGFSHESALGTTDVMDANLTSLRNAVLFGARLGVTFVPQLGIEVEGGLIPTEPRSLVFSVYSVSFRGHLIAQLRNKNNPDQKVVPFFVIGAGTTNIISSKVPDVVAEDSMISPYAGVGAKFRLSTGFGLRLDLRGFLDSKAADKSAFDYEVLGAVYKEFGAKKPAPKKVEPPPPPPPPVDDDPDKDGIKGAADKCPNDPEDKDGFEDEDGCPDLDNDKDGIPDKDDKCPMEAEDKDGFQDEDGCPDPDNDNDGIPDKDDKCPMEPETKNGYLDDDGCPDEIPQKLKAFTGTIQGINFKLGDAALQPTSNAVLDKAVAVLKEFADLKLEIQGHTDDQPLKAGGKFADNTALSQARAETVKDYFVKKGIDASRLTAKGYGDSQPVEDPKGLTGPKLEQARSKNRRVEFKLLSSNAPTP